MSRYKVKQLSGCRLCGSPDLKSIFSRRDVPFFDEVVYPENVGKEFKSLLEIFVCCRCLSVQTQHEVNINHYYETYQYVASDSEFVRRYMDLTVGKIVQRFFPRKGKVIDVGAADGYFLSVFKRHGFDVIGFEAAENLAAKAKESGIEVLNNLFGKHGFELLPHDFKRVELITMLHTFDHLFDPSSFLEDAKTVLDPDTGILLLEVHDFADIFDNYEVALFGHEHATYLHFASMSRLLERHGYRIVDYNFIPKKLCRGSSMLIAATLSASSVKSNIDEKLYRREEFDAVSTYAAFSDRVNLSLEKVKDFILSEKLKGRKVAAYGGWGRGVTTLAMLELEPNTLEFVVDANPRIWGALTPATNYEIVAPSYLTTATANIVVVFNHAYLDEIKTQNHEFIAQGGVFKSIIELLQFPVESEQS